MNLAILSERFVNTEFRLVNVTFHQFPMPKPCCEYEPDEWKITMKNGAEFSYSLSGHSPLFGSMKCFLRMKNRQYIAKQS